MGLDILEHQLHQHLTSLDMDDYLERQDCLKLEAMKENLKEWLTLNESIRGEFLVYVEQLKCGTVCLTQWTRMEYLVEFPDKNELIREGLFFGELCFLESRHIYSLVIDHGAQFETSDGNTFDKGIL